MSGNRVSLVECEGWWHQGWCGRQPMHDLRLTFQEGTIQGSGTDIIGPFIFRGILSEHGAVVLRKHYLGQHEVEYLGTFDGEGGFSGEWTVGCDHGPWMIRLRRTERDSSTEIQEFGPR